ncbi:MAG TPA: aspartyl/asparaginyl beta-hydroxylase domain-containing protein [Novosphingobium sp.]|nr:aspartyl/asparaginyl beta-hydroxylase domain-containing protein [Novosphingobium sp.]
MTQPSPADPAPDLAVAQAANAEGLAAIRAGDAAAAVAAFTRATAADPLALPLWRNLAHAHRLAGNDPAEEAALERALTLDRLDFGTQLRMAQLLQRTGKETAGLIAWNGVFQLAERQAGALPPAVEQELAAGRAYCEALQARLGAHADTLLAAGHDLWDETEQRRIKAFVDRTLGRRTVYVNECAGLHYPFLPADEFFDRRHFPWLEELEAHTAEIREELLGILDDPGEAIRPYVRMEEGAPENKWSALDHSLDWGACFLWEHGEPNLPVHARCPRTAAVLERLPLLRIPGRGPAAFFSILKPHSHIPPHTGVTNTRAIIHLPLIVPPGCGFRVGGETREWIVGQAFAFDDTIEHEAWNTSDERRAVLIIDAWNPHLSEREREAITEYIRGSDAALA